MNLIIRINQNLFEYDIYHLIRAFFPEAAIRTIRTDEAEIAEKDNKSDEAIADFIFEMQYFGKEPDGFRFLVKDEKGVRIDRSETFVNRNDRPAMKNQLKKLVYLALKQITGKSLPWGDLTGIRPIKNVIRLFHDGNSKAEVSDFLKHIYCMDEDKSEMAIRIAERQMQLLSDADPANSFSLYVDVPFCSSICSYCTFGSHQIGTWSHAVEPYLLCLKKELECICELMHGYRLDTIYVGGGTPTSIPPDDLRRLLGWITEMFHAEQVREFTVEAGRPDTISEAHLNVLKEFPVNRISVNPQTMHDETLRRIGRKHSASDTERAFALARTMGFDNINMDLIIGLPGEGYREMKETLQRIEAMSPDSLTIHSLARKRSSRLNLEEQDSWKFAFENSREIMGMAESCAERLGMHPYYLYRQKNMAGNFENVGYAKEGKEGIYNILIMEECQSILAAGSGGATKLVHKDGVARVENVKDLNHYCNRIDEMCERIRIGVNTYLQAHN